MADQNSNNVEVTVAAEPPPLSALAKWSTLALLAIGALIAFIDRTNISTAIAVPEFQQHFELSDIDRGWVASAFFWSYALFQMPMGYIVDRYGVKFPYAICFALWCLASAAIGLVSVMSMLIVFRLIVGLSEAVVVPATYRWIRHNFDPDKSGKPVGLYLLGTKLGTAVGAPLAAWLVVKFDWQMMFYVTGLAGMLWLMPWMYFLRNDLPKKKAVNVTKKKKTPAVPMKSIFSSPLVWGTLVVNFCYNYFSFFCMTWMPAYLVEQRGLSLKEMGLYTFFSFAGIAIVALVAGWAADKLIARYGRPILIRKAFVIAGFVCASTVLLGARAESLQAALFWNVASLSGLGLTSANNLVLCSLTLIPKQVVGFVKGFQNSATAAAGIVAPIMTGWLLDKTGNFLAPMTMVFGFLVLGALTVLFILRPEWGPKVDDEEVAVAA